MDPNTTEQPDKPETQPSHDVAEDENEPSPEVVGFFAKHEKVFVGVGVIAGVVLAVVAVITLSLKIFGSGDGGSGERPPAPPQPGVASKTVTILGQAKPPGVHFWSGTLRILPRHGRVRFRIRVGVTGSEELTGVVAEAELAEPIGVVPRKCWYRGGQCPGSLLEGGVPLPDLQPGTWTSVVFSADVPSTIYGGTFPAILKINSDQGKFVDRAEIVVSATDAEEAVRPFVREVAESLAAAGKSAEVAGKSKRLLLGQWPTLTLEHPHPFEQIKQYEDSIDGRPIVVDDLNYERWLEGQVVRLRGRVVRRPRNNAVAEDVVEQRVDLRNPGGGTRLRCHIPRPWDHLFVQGEEIEVKAVIVAWGPEGSSDADLTVAVCPAARAVRLSRRPRSGAGAG